MLIISYVAVEGLACQKSVFARLRTSKRLPDLFDDAGSFIHFMLAIKSVFVSATAGLTVRTVEAPTTVAHESKRDCRRKVRRSVCIATFRAPFIRLTKIPLCTATNKYILQLLRCKARFRRRNLTNGAASPCVPMQEFLGSSLYGDFPPDVSNFLSACVSAIR